MSWAQRRKTAERTSLHGNVHQHSRRVGREERGQALCLQRAAEAIHNALVRAVHQLKPLRVQNAQTMSHTANKSRAYLLDDVERCDDSIVRHGCNGAGPRVSKLLVARLIPAQRVIHILQARHAIEQLGSRTMQEERQTSSAAKCAACDGMAPETAGRSERQ